MTTATLYNQLLEAKRLRDASNAALDAWDENKFDPETDLACDAACNAWDEAAAQTAEMIVSFSMGQINLETARTLVYSKLDAMIEKARR